MNKNLSKKTNSDLNLNLNFIEKKEKVVKNNKEKVVAVSKNKKVVKSESKEKEYV